MTLNLSGLSPTQANTVLCAVERAAWSEYVIINADLEAWTASSPASPARLEMEGWRDACKKVSQHATDLRNGIK